MLRVLGRVRGGRLAGWTREDGCVLAGELSTGSGSRGGLHRGGGRYPDERGSVSLELAVLAPGLLLVLGVLVLGGRIEVAGQAVEQAASDAARQASIARSPGQAQAAAQGAARASLGEQSLACTRVQVTVDTSGFAVQAGQPAQVAATVTCPVRLSDLGIPGAPGTRTMTARAVSALDTYRER